MFVAEQEKEHCLHGLCTLPMLFPAREKGKNDMCGTLIPNSNWSRERTSIEMTTTRKRDTGGTDRDCTTSDLQI